MIAVLYLIFSASLTSIYGVAVPSAAAAIFWIESWKMWKHTSDLIEKPSKPKENEKEVNHHFWISLMPGAAALAVFLAASFFLFYYVEPNSNSLFLQNTFSHSIEEQQSSQLTPTTNIYDQPVTADESVKMAEQKMALVSHDNINNKNNNSILFSSSPFLVPVLLMAGAIVTVFLVYLMLRYHCDIGRSVLVSERSWN